MSLRYGTHLLPLCGKGSEKERWPLPALLSGIKLLPTSSFTDAGPFSSSRYISDAFQSADPMLEVRGSESK